MSTEERDAFIQAHLSHVDLATLSPSQLAHVVFVYSGSSQDEELMKRLTGCLDETGLIGALARSEIAARSLNGYSEEVRARNVVAAVSHPAFPTAIGSTAAFIGSEGDAPWEVLFMLSLIDDDSFESVVSGLILTGERLVDEGDPSQVLNFTRRLIPVKERIPEEAYIPLGHRIRELTEEWVDGAQVDEATASKLHRSTVTLTTPRLIGKKAPRLTIRWDSENDGLKGLDDLEDQVVLIDFWNTGCRPCIREFRGLRALQSHYEGYAFTILGVSGYEGWHSDPEKGVIDCSGDRNKEHGLMPGFMKHHGMNWPVVFTEEGTYNAEYATVGIPHKVLLDPSGIVRAVTLPGVFVSRDGRIEPDFQHLRPVIDELLKEAGLPTPP